MDKLIVDSSLLIEISRGEPRALAFARSIPTSRLLIHPVCAAEVLVGAASETDRRALDRGLAARPFVRVSGQDFDHCLAFIRRYTLAHGIGWEDCVIAATALRLGVAVATLNDRHFRVIQGLRVLRPY